MHRHNRGHDRTIVATDLEYIGIASHHLHFIGRYHLAIYFLGCDPLGHAIGGNTDLAIHHADLVVGAFLCQDAEALAGSSCGTSLQEVDGSHNVVFVIILHHVVLNGLTGLHFPHQFVIHCPVDIAVVIRKAEDRIFQRNDQCAILLSSEGMGAITDGCHLGSVTQSQQCTHVDNSQSIVNIGGCRVIIHRLQPGGEGLALLQFGGQLLSRLGTNRLIEAAQAPLTEAQVFAGHIQQESAILRSGKYDLIMIALSRHGHGRLAHTHIQLEGFCQLPVEHKGITIGFILHQHIQFHHIAGICHDHIHSIGQRHIIQGSTHSHAVDTGTQRPGTHFHSLKDYLVDHICGQFCLTAIGVQHQIIDMAHRQQNIEGSGLCVGKIKVIGIHRHLASFLEIHLGCVAGGLILLVLIIIPTNAGRIRSDQITARSGNIQRNLRPGDHAGGCDGHSLLIHQDLYGRGCLIAVHTNITARNIVIIHVFAQILLHSYITLALQKMPMVGIIAGPALSVNMAAKHKVTDVTVAIHILIHVLFGHGGSTGVALTDMPVAGLISAPLLFKLVIVIGIFKSANITNTVNIEVLMTAHLIAANITELVAIAVCMAHSVLHGTAVLTGSTMPVETGIHGPILAIGVGVRSIIPTANVAHAIVFCILMGCTIAGQRMLTAGLMPVLVLIHGPLRLVSMGMLCIQIGTYIANAVLVFVHMGCLCTLLALMLTSSRMPVMGCVRHPLFFVKGVLAGLFIAAVIADAIHVVIHVRTHHRLQGAAGADLPVAGFIGGPGFRPGMGVFGFRGFCLLLAATACKHRQHHHHTQRHTKNLLHIRTSVSNIPSRADLAARERHCFTYQS